MSRVKLYVLDFGEMMMDKNLMVGNSVLATRENPNRPAEYITFPVPGFLIETPGGYILCDTGCNPGAMGPNGRWPQEFQVRSPFLGGADCSAVNRLKELGLAPDDVKTVVLTHMHNDHAGGVEFFPHARFLVNRNEFDACIRCYATHDYMSSYIWADTDQWIRHRMNWDFISEKDGDIRLAPGVTLLNFGPGHARGMLGLYLELEKTGGVIITSDAVYCEENFGPPMLEPGVVFDTVGWRATTRRIHLLAEQTGSQVWFGHDMKQFKNLVKAPHGCYD